MGPDLSDVYKEYFMGYLASITKVGPKITKIYGYDIIITKEKAFFVMEKCK